jgi:hypothetical protein
MNATCLATNLLGRRVRLSEPPVGTTKVEGVIASVYLVAEGMHYVVLVDGRLVLVPDGSQLTVLRLPDL